MTLRMKDIAKELGVSVSTVSRAMRNDPHISLETRMRIMMHAARNNRLTMRKTISTNISYIIDRSYFLFTSNFYNPLIEIIEDEVQKKGYHLQFSTIDSVEKLLAKVDLYDTAGILMTSSYIEELLPIISLYNIPVVLIDSYLPLEDTSAVLTDNIGGLMKAVKFLVDRGHREIGYMEGELEDIDCLDRLTGYKRGLEMAGIPIKLDYILQCKLSMSSSYQSMLRFLKQTEQIPTAFAGVNDIVTIGGMQAAKDSGMQVPDQISFIGFDDIDLSAEVNPPLTTVHVDIHAMGLLSVQRLIELIENKPINFHKMMINPTIVNRSSVATFKT